jgi:hypothetical protein
MDLGVVAGPDVEAVPAPAGGALQDAGGDDLQVAAVEGGVLGEGLQGLPVLFAVEADQGLGDGVFFDVEGQAGDPLDEAAETACVVKADLVGGEQRLPEQPQSDSLQEAPPGEGSGIRQTTPDKLSSGGAFVNPPDNKRLFSVLRSEKDY